MIEIIDPKPVKKKKNKTLIYGSILLVFLLFFGLVQLAQIGDENNEEIKDWGSYDDYVVLKPALDPELEINDETLELLNDSSFFEEIEPVRSCGGFCREFIFRLTNPLPITVDFDDIIETSMYQDRPYEPSFKYYTKEYINNSRVVTHISYVPNMMQEGLTLPNGTIIYPMNEVITESYIIDEGYEFIETNNPFISLTPNQEKIIKVQTHFVPRTEFQNIDWAIEANINGFEFNPNWIWFNVSYLTKKQFTITENSYRDFTNLSTLINVTYEIEMETDFSDITFVDSTESYELSLFREETYDSNHAIIWVDVPSISSGGTTDIYMYYNSDDANDLSNWSSVFQFEVEDNSINTNKWTVLLDNNGATTLRVDEINNRLEMEVIENSGSPGSSAIINTSDKFNITDFWMINFTTEVAEAICRSSDCGSVSGSVNLIDEEDEENLCNFPLVQEAGNPGNAYDHHNWTNWTIMMNQTNPSTGKKEYVLFKYNGSLGQPPQLWKKASCLIDYDKSLALRFQVSADDSGGQFAETRLYITNLGIRKWNHTEPTVSEGSESQYVASLHFENHTINSTLGLNTTTDNLTTSFTPITDSTESIYANLSWIVDFYNSSTDTNYLGEGLIFGWHSSNTSDYVGGRIAVENGLTAGNDEGYLGLGTFFNANSASDYIEFNAIELTNYTNYTLAGWAYVLPNGLTIGNGIFGSADSGKFFQLFDDANQVKFRNQALGYAVFMTSSDYYNQWIHYAWVANGTIEQSSMAFYLNGEFVSAANTDTTFTFNEIGRSRAVATDYFNGTLDEILLWEKALNATLIEDLYNKSVSWRTEDIALTNNTFYQTELHSDNLTLNEYWRTEVYPSVANTSNSSTSNDIYIGNLLINLDGLYLNTTSSRNRTTDNVTVSFTPNSEYLSYDANITFYENNTDTQTVVERYKISNINVLEDTYYTYYLDAANTTRNESFLVQIDIVNGTEISYWNTSWVTIDKTNLTAVDLAMGSNTGLNTSYEDLNLTFTPDDTDTPFYYRIWIWVNDILTEIGGWIYTTATNLVSVVIDQGNFSAGDNVSVQIETNGSEGENFFQNITTDIFDSIPTNPILQYPNNNSLVANYSIVLSCDGSTDPDNSTQTTQYEFYVNSSNLPTTIHQNSTNETFNFGLDFPTFNGDYWWRCRANDNQSVSNYTSTRLFSVDRRNILGSTIYYESSVIEGSSTYFEMNISLNNLLVKNISESILTYNNTNYTASITEVNSSYFKLSTSINVPLADTNPTTKTFFWYNSLGLKNGTINTNTSVSNTQSIFQISLTACGDFTVGADEIMVFNYTFKDDDDYDNVYFNASDFEVAYTIFGNPNNKEVNRTLSFEYLSTNISNVSICFSPKNQSFYTDGHISYSQVNEPVYDRRNYFYDNYFTTNTTHNTNLFLLQFSRATATTIRVIDEIESPIVDALIYVDKHFIGKDIFETIGMGKTNSDGEDNIFLNQEETWYKIRVEKNNVILKTLTKQQILGDLIIRIAGETFVGEYEELEQPTTTLTFNNNTKIINATFLGVSGINYTLDVYERRPENDTWICSNMYSNSPITLSSISCYYGNRTGGIMIASLSSSKFNNEGINVKSLLQRLEIDLTSDLLKDTLGTDGLWLAFLIIVTLTFVGLFAPEIALIFGTLGLIVSVMIGFVSISWGSLVGIIIAVIFVIIKGSRR